MNFMLLIFCIFLFAVCSHAQNTDPQVTAEIAYLKLSGADAFLIYAAPCIGSVRLYDTCGLKDIQYLFWREKGIYYMKKFGSCNNYQAIPVDTLNPFTYYFANANIIDEEEIKEPTNYVYKNKKDSEAVSEFVDHTCLFDVTILFKNKKLFKEASEFNLNFEKFDNGQTNIYYHSNQQTKFKHLLDMIGAFIKKSEV